MAARSVAGCGRGEQGEVRERRGVYGVVAPAMASQVSQHAGPEAQRWTDRPPTVGGVQRAAGRDRDDLDAARRIRPLAGRPLAAREVGHLMTMGGQRRRERAIPPLGSADRVGKETVVDDADPHLRVSLPYAPGVRPRLRTSRARAPASPRGRAAPLSARPFRASFRASFPRVLSGRPFRASFRASFPGVLSGRPFRASFPGVLSARPACAPLARADMRAPTCARRLARAALARRLARSTCAPHFRARLARPTSAPPPTRHGSTRQARPPPWLRQTSHLGTPESAGPTLL